MNLKKDAASKSSKITVKLDHSPPTFAHSFKFFVKETSNEYYNLAMDRWYNAEDGNVWISFPSSERNKVDDESYLILKKEHDANTPVDDEARYKVISISNDVPEFITLSKKLYGSVSNNISNTLFGDTGGGGIPEPKSKFLYVDKEAFDEQMGAAETDALTDVEQFIKIKTSTSTSHWYEVASLRAIELLNTGVKDTYKIGLVESFGEELKFTTTNNTGLYADIVDGIKLQVSKQVRKIKAEHRGRFFVKIFKDGVLQSSIMKAKNEEQSYISVFSEPIYHINNPSSYLLPDSWFHQSPLESGGTNFWGTVWGVFDYENSTKNWWRNFGSHWFFDNVRSRNNASSHSKAGDKLDNDGNTLANGGTATGGITNAKKKMHLAFSGIYAPGTTNAPQDTYSVNNHANGFPPLIDIGVDSNLDEKTWLDYIKEVGTVFKFSKDPDGQMYVVEKAELFKSLCTKNKNSDAIEDDLTNFDFIMGGEYKQSSNKRVRYEITVGQWNGSGAKPTQALPGLGIGVSTPAGYDPISGSSGVAGANHYDNAHAIEILEIEDKEDEGDFSSTNPAIWETEPKEDIGLDLYYEASDANPINLDYKTNEIYIPATSYLTLPGDRTWETSNAVYVPASTLKVTAFNDDTISINGIPLSQHPVTLLYTEELAAGDSIIFTKPSGGMVTGTVITYTTVGTTATIKLSPNLHGQKYYLDWFNCYSFGNGVESNRIRDDFNAFTIDKGPRVSTTLATPYEEERKTNGLIYSGIYNSTSGVNNLNQFIMAEKITKDISPRFGSIQKLHARDSDLVTLCEDKIVKLLANKDALFNADGNPQLIATDRVLGQTVPFAGEHGISKNPESFATQAYQSYFSDKSRGVIMRLGKGGLHPVSEHGMKDWFSDNLKHAQTIIGSYDDKKSLYNITLKDKAEAAISVVVPLSDISYADVNSLVLV